MQLLKLLLLCATTGIIMGSDTITEPLPSYSGLFYQEEGILLSSDESWKLVIYKDLKPIFIAKESLLRLSNKFQSIYSNVTNFPFVQSTKTFLNINLNKIENRLSELNMYLGKNSRNKRELLDGFGSVLKWLIGTPDAKDAKHYNDCIDKLERRELELSNLMQKQLQITSSTVSNFNETIFKIYFDEQVLNENINRLNTYLNSTKEIIYSIKLSQDISTISLQILELVTSLEGEIDDSLTSILFAKSNTIHPSIINLNKLYQELLLSNHIRSTKTLVAPVTLDNIHMILDSSTFSAYVYSDRLVYIIDFPLVSKLSLTLYHIYSVPISHINSSLYTTILPEHKYVATNQDGQQYASFSSLENCRTYTTRKMVCKQLVLYDSTARPICDVQILFSATTALPRSCITTTFPADINTFQPLNNNRWLYVLSKETRCILQCNEEIAYYTLQGNGLLKLQPNCKLHTGYSTLSAFHSFEDNITSPIIIPDIRTDDCFEQNKEMKPTKLLPVSLNEAPLDSLKLVKHHLDEYSEELQKLKAQESLQRTASNFSWPYLITGLIMLGLILLKCYCSCPTKFLRRRQRKPDSCIQIFNNCFESPRNQCRTNVSIPMAAIPSTSTSCISEDEDEDPNTNSTNFQTSGKHAQSLF